MKFFFTLCGFVVSVCLANSQTFQSTGGQIINSSNIGIIGSDHLPDSFLKSDNKVIKYQEIEGSPYINNYSGAENNLPIGKVYTSDLSYLGTAFIRYNAYTDNMEISLMDDGVDYYLFKKQADFHYIVLRKKRYRAYEYASNNLIAIGFFVIVSKDDADKCALLKKEKITFKEEVYPKNSFTNGTPANFKQVRDTYFLKVEKVVLAIPKKKKNLWQLFPDKKAEMKAFIDAKKIKLTNEDDLLDVIDYYNAFIK